MKPVIRLPPLRAARPLDQVRERLQYGHYSLSTERSYVHWVRWFVRFHGLLHPRKVVAAEVQTFLTWLANRRGTVLRFRFSLRPLHRAFLLTFAFPRSLSLLRDLCVLCASALRC